MITVGKVQETDDFKIDKDRKSLKKKFYFGTSDCPWGEHIFGLNKYSTALCENSNLVTYVQYYVFPIDCHDCNDTNDDVTWVWIASLAKLFKAF